MGVTMKKYLFFFILGIFGTLGLYLGISNRKPAINQEKAEQTTYQKISTQAAASTKKFFMDKLLQEEASFHQALSNEFGINTASLEADYSHQWRQNPGISASTEPMHRLTYEVAQAFNFNADKLRIVLNHTDNGSPAYSNDMELIIEMNLFPEFAQPVQKFIIAHELQHILQADCAQLRAIKKRVNQNYMSPSQTKLFESYNKFQEKRADFKAALQGIEWAQGYLAFAQEGLKRCKSGAGNLHPTWQERVAWAQDIVDHMQNIKTA
jgi:hypothetical protein